MIPTKNFLLSAITLSLFYMCSSPDDESSSPAPAIETFGAWGPAFADQTSNFQQTRTGSNGTVQTRDVTVTESSVSLDANERQDGIDLNNDGDSVDYYTITETTYSASIGGSFSETSFVITKDQESNFFTVNFGIWSTINGSTPIPIIYRDQMTGQEEVIEALMAYEILDEDFNTYTATGDVTCFTKEDSTLPDGASGEIILAEDYAIFDVYGLDPNDYLIYQEDFDLLSSYGISKVGMYYSMEIIDFQDVSALFSGVSIYATSPSLSEDLVFYTLGYSMLLNYVDSEGFAEFVCQNSSKSKQPKESIFRELKEIFKDKGRNLKSIQLKSKESIHRDLINTLENKI